MRWRSLSLGVALAAPLGGALTASAAGSPPPGTGAVAEAAMGDYASTSAPSAKAEVGRKFDRSEGASASEDVPVASSAAGGGGEERGAEEAQRGAPAAATAAGAAPAPRTTATPKSATSTATRQRRRLSSKRSHITVQNEKLLADAVSMASSGKLPHARHLLSREVKRLRSTLEVTSSSHEEHREITRSLGHSLLLLGDVSSRAGKLKEALRSTREAAPFLLSTYGKLDWMERGRARK